MTKQFLSKMAFGIALLTGMSGFCATADAVTMQVGEQWKVDFTLEEVADLGVGVNLNPTAEPLLSLFDGTDPVTTDLDCGVTTGCGIGHPFTNSFGYLLVKILSAPSGAPDVTAFALNQQGVDVGNFTYTLLNPVPLPAAFPLFASGLALMGCITRRKKRKATV